MKLYIKLISLLSFQRLYDNNEFVEKTALVLPVSFTIQNGMTRNISIFLRGSGSGGGGMI